MDPTIAATETAPAGGAAMGQVIGMTIGLFVAFGAVVVLGEMHRSGRRTPLGLAGAFAERVSGLPAWAAIPLAVCAVALPGALFGYMWDAGLHIDRGRDDGPLANPSHYLILAGLYGIIAAGYLSTVFPKPGQKPGRGALKLADNFQIPLGGGLILFAGFFAFAGFPLDDIWHRLFGQDVTLWGPTHLIMLGGGMLTLVGVVLLFEEGVANSPRRRIKGVGEVTQGRDVPVRTPVKRLDSPLARLADALPTVPLRPSRMLIAGGFLAGFSIFQGEFDYGVPQFELVLQPLQLAVSASIALVAARVWLGAGGALGAVGFYLLIRGIVSLLVGPVFGETAPAFPLYVPEAICVELAALLLARRPLMLGAASGLLIGTVGFAGEWRWINAVMPIGWSENLLPEGPIVATVGGIAGGMIGALFGLALRRELPAPRLAAPVAVASLAAIIGAFAFGLADRNVEGSASVTTAEVSPPPNREVIATVRFDPPQVTEGANWVRVVAWQGGGLVNDELEEISPGVFRTPNPVPVHGTWKAGLRIQNGHTLAGIRLYAPADAAIPLPEDPALPAFTRPLVPDRELLQRERKDDIPTGLWLASSLAVLFMFFGFFALLGWALNRYSKDPGSGPKLPRRPEPRREPTPTAPQPAGVA